MRKRLITMLILLVAGAALLAAAQRQSPAASADAALRQRIVAYFNRTIVQGLDAVEVLSISPPDASGLRTVRVRLSKGSQHAEETVYITADGRKIIVGQIENLNGDPWRATREQLTPGNSPTEGPAAAPVTIYEFSDLECPYCKEENQSLQQLVQAVPAQVRVVFKYYPLINIHPWSMQAAQAAACVTRQNPAHFWTFEQAVFDHQDDLNPTNAAARLRDFALESGTNGAQFDACLQSPETRAIVDRTIAEGKAVGVLSTPTLYIDGRQINGAIPYDTLKMVVSHEAQVAPQYDRAALDGPLKGAQCGLCSPPPPPPKPHQP